MSDRDRRAFIKEINEIASKGLRCLALAEIPNSGKLSNITVENKQDLLSDITKFNEFEQGASLIGMVAIRDPPRQEVKPAIKDCTTAGVRVIMITGDSKETAMSIAKEL